MKALRFMKYGKEYRQELLRTPYFWIGVLLIPVAILLAQFKLINGLIEVILLVVGFFLIFGMKQRILGRLEERHFKKK